MITAAFESLNSSALLTVSPIWCRWPMGITNDRRPIDQQVRRVDEILSRAQISLGSLDRRVTQEQLDLLKFAATSAA